MTTANINIRVDSDLKRSAEELFSDLRLNMSTAITMFLRCAVNNDGIPFEVKRKVPNAQTRAAFAEYEKMIKDPKSNKRYESVDEMLKKVLEDE